MYKFIMYKGLRAVVSFCFEKTELRRLWARVADGNMAPCKILEKCGFKEEGLVRQGKMMHTYCDYYKYGYIKDDYPAI
jgi:ribosomal-protein-alanine N-acetyltransferase